MAKLVKVTVQAGDIYINPDQVCLLSPVVDKENDVPILGRTLVKVLSGEVLIIEDAPDKVAAMLNRESYPLS